ncbi:MAG: hypothetical protein HYR67_16485 [Bacteroidetes bacterium]|nr:hypothetical protein [Bacteroidota bacterium]
MKIISLAALFGIISFYSNSQQRISETIVVDAVKYKLTNFGVQLNSGAAKYLFDRKTEKYFGNYWSPAIRLNFYYKNFIGGFGLRPTTLNSKDSLFFDQYTLHTHQDFHLINGIYFIGYKIELSKNFSLEPYIGGLVTHYSLAHPTQRFASEFSKGYTVGISINKYFEKSPGQYLVVFLSGNINKSNYHQIHADLGDRFYAIEFGLAYKVWCTKKIK